MLLQYKGEKEGSMMRKQRNNKKVLALVMSLTLFSAVLGTSYASWSKTTIVDTKITSGEIAAIGAVERQYIMCTNTTCVNGDIHRQQPSIQVQLEQDSIPIEIRKIELLEFEYTAEVWSGKDEFKWLPIPAYYWKWNDSPTYQTVTLTDAVKNIPCMYEKDDNNRITILLGEQGQGDLQIKNAMTQAWSVERPQDRPNWADVYVGNTGKLTFRITYTQFNTKNVGGWEKTMDVEVRVSWYRKRSANISASSIVFPDNGNISIKPGEESKFR